MSFDCCWFDCVTSEPAPATVLPRSAATNHLPTTTRLGYKQLRPTTARVSVNYYYYSDTNELLASTRLQVNYQPLRGEFTNCYYFSTTRSPVQFSSFILLPTTMLHLWNQLTYRERSLLQTFTTTTGYY